MAAITPASFDLEVRFYELDPYGHVNHATYLQYFEAARVTWLDSIGQGLDVLLEAGSQLIVIAVATRFVAPAVLHDRLTIETAMVRSRRVRAQWAQRAMRGDELIACQRVNFAVTNLSGRPTRIPEPLADAMAQFEVGEEWASKDLPDLAL
jgi:acyl-CoA thioester hydrolase